MPNLVEIYREHAALLARWFNDPVCSTLPEEQRWLCALQGYRGGYAAIGDSTLRFPANCAWAAQRLRQFAEAAQRRK